MRRLSRWWKWCIIYGGSRGACLLSSRFRIRTHLCVAPRARRLQISRRQRAAGRLYSIILKRKNFNDAPRSSKHHHSLRFV